MIKHLILYIFILFLPICTHANLDKKINGISKKIQQTNKLNRLNYQQFKKLGNNILKDKAKLKKINRQLKNLSIQLSSKKKQLSFKRKQRKNIQRKNNKIIKDIENIQKDFINHISKNLSLILILNNISVQNIDDIIQESIFIKYSQIVDSKIQNLLNQLRSKKKYINSYQSKIRSLSKYITNIDTKIQKEYILKKEKISSIKKLKNRMKIYSKKIKRHKRNKNYLANLLKKLKIRKNKKKVKKIKKYKTIIQQEPNINIKQVNTSYTREKTIRYRGKRHIAPISRYKVISKFGTNFDKVYNIKTFNRSVILKSKIKNQKVRSVLNGTIIFANNTPTLNKTIIIEHTNGYHTIYANLSDIAPRIKKGRKIKRGYVIGRISDELTFEVVKKNYYINPLYFIQKSK
jgi:septal ring factor EnvC (AmiA/AmiB activator)